MPQAQFLPEAADCTTGKQNIQGFDVIARIGKDLLRGGGGGGGTFTSHYGTSTRVPHALFLQFFAFSCSCGTTIVLISFRRALGSGIADSVSGINKQDFNSRPPFPLPHPLLKAGMRVLLDAARLAMVTGRELASFAGAGASITAAAGAAVLASSLSDRALLSTECGIWNASHAGAFGAADEAAALLPQQASKPVRCISSQGYWHVDEASAPYESCPRTIATTTRCASPGIRTTPPCVPFKHP